MKASRILPRAGGVLGVGDEVGSAGSMSPRDEEVQGIVKERAVVEM